MGYESALYIVEKGDRDNKMETPIQLNEVDFSSLNETMRKLVLMAVSDGMGMWARLGYCANGAASLMDKGVQETDLDWDFINQILETGRDPYDFDIYEKPITSFKALNDARLLCIQNSILNMAWHERVCVDCGETFHINYSESNFFKEKGMVLPKRRRECRDYRKAHPGMKRPKSEKKDAIDFFGKEIFIAPLEERIKQVEDDRVRQRNTPTAMEIAMQKAKEEKGK